MIGNILTITQSPFGVRHEHKMAAEVMFIFPWCVQALMYSSVMCSRVCFFILYLCVFTFLKLLNVSGPPLICSRPSVCV